MKCSPSLLSEYRDGELSPQKRIEVEDHLRRCAECRKTLSEYESISRAIRALPRFEVPGALVKDVYAKVRVERVGFGSPFSRVGLLRLGSLAAVTLVIVLAASTLFRGASSSQPDLQAGVPSNEMSYDDPANLTAIALPGQPTPIERVEGPTGSSAQNGPLIPQQPDEKVERKREPGPTNPPVAQPTATPMDSAPEVAPNALAQATSVPEAAKTEPPRATPVASPETPLPTPASPELPRSVAEVPPTTVREATSTRSQTPAAPTATPATGPFSIATTIEITHGAAVSATAEITRGITASPTVHCSITPNRSFELVYREIQGSLRGLECAIADEKTLQLTEESFESGIVFWRSDTRQIYALSSKGTWKVYKDTWAETDPPSPSMTPPEGKYAPVKGIGKVWRQDASVRAALGWAVEPERSYSGTVQEFEKGAMLWSARRMIYVLQADGTWQQFPDYYDSISREMPAGGLP